MGESNQPLPIGKYIKPWGCIAAVDIIKDERYYWFASSHTAVTTDVVSMIPAFIMEAQ